jgi:GT2 family glycosyltransferase
MIDARFFRRCGGFDRNLTGRDRMLDLCLKARAGGMRVVYVPSAIAFRRHKELLSTQQSHERLLHRWQNTLSKGDPFYNVNLPMGLDNYTLS